MLANCMPSYLIAQELSKDGKITVRQAHNYIHKIREEIAELNKECKPEIYVPTLVTQAEQFYLRCINLHHTSVALNTLKWIAELRGIKPTPLIQQTINQDNTQIKNMSGEELETELLKLGYSRNG